MGTRETHTAVSARQQRRRTDAAERATGQFYCSSSNHFTTGDYQLLRGRKICATCAAKRRKLLRRPSDG